MVSGEIMPFRCSLGAHNTVINSITVAIIMIYCHKCIGCYVATMIVCVEILAQTDLSHLMTAAAF